MDHFVDEFGRHGIDDADDDDDDPEELIERVCEEYPFAKKQGLLICFSDLSDSMKDDVYFRLLPEAEDILRGDD